VLGISLMIGIQQLRIPELRALNVYLSRNLRHQRGLLAGSVAMEEAIARFARAADMRELWHTLQAALEQSTFSRAELRLAAYARPPADGQPPARSWKWVWTRSGSTPGAPDWQMTFSMRGASLTLHHTQDADYPVSAICWLGQGMTAEFERALRRLREQEHLVRRREALQTAALARRPATSWDTAQGDATARA
jgi:hypothetical protein